jgi:hypothetical protein
MDIDACYIVLSIHVTVQRLAVQKSFQVGKLSTER